MIPPHMYTALFTISQPKENKDLIVQVAKLSDKVTVSTAYTLCIDTVYTLWSYIHIHMHVLCSEFLSCMHGRTFQKFQQSTKVFPSTYHTFILLLCKAKMFECICAVGGWAYISPLWWLLKVWGLVCFTQYLWHKV